MRAGPTRAGVALGAALVLLGAPAGAWAQGVEAMASQCGGGSAALTAACLEVALAAQAVQAGAGLAAGMGTELAGYASTVGKRVGGNPRLSGALRGGFVRFHLPDVLGDSNTPARGTSVVASSLQATGVLGIFDGLSVAPTVGGILSVDLIGSGSLLFLPEGDGFSGTPHALGIGARVGIVRESFTMPGVTASVMRRWLGDIPYGGDDQRAFAGVGDDYLLTKINSVRLTAGKDLLALGLYAGGGYDRYDSDVTIVASAPGGSTSGTANSTDFSNDRLLLYGGASFTFLVLQLSAEGGWAEGFEAPAGRPAGGYDPGSSSLFGSVAVRLTF